MNPPDHAARLPVDEKTQIQALGRTQRPLPMQPGHATGPCNRAMQPGHAGTRTHDDRRNGTTTLPAAPDVATGRNHEGDGVVGQMTERHRSADVCAVPGHAAAGPGPDTEVPVIPGTLSARRSARVHARLRAHPRD